jgi:plasmid stabilization system protein ParE
MRYEVRITTPALDRIYEQASYIATEQQEPEIAARWLQRILNAGSSLGEMPHRCPRAIEDAFFPYEVRAMVIGQFVLQFTVVEDTKTVWVVGARHGRQLPRPGHLPVDLESLDDGEGCRRP